MLTSDAVGRRRGTVPGVRLTDFWTRMERNLGSTYARSWAHDVVLTDLGGLTVDEALATHLDVQVVWRAVAAQLELPARER